MEIRSRSQFGELLEHLQLINLPAAEVGVAEGRYARDILSWGVPLIYLVDLWEQVPGGYACLAEWTDEEHEANYQNCLKLIKSFGEERHKILRGWTHEQCEFIPDNSLGFCYIDASHDYENVLRDIHSYRPKVIEGGILAGHDWFLNGVRKAVTEYVFSNYLNLHLVKENEGDSSWWIQL